MSATSRNTFSITKRAIIFFILLCFGVLGIVYIFQDGMEKEEAIKQLNVIDARTATEVEILDATGSTRKVFDIVQLLREHGYDVVELRRSANGILEMSCIVVYNESKKVEAKKIAHLLSIESKRIAVKPDSKAMLDISILLGTDILKSNR